MVISHEYKFIFVKTRKTAGTSIEVHLSQHCADRDVFTPIYPPVTPHVPRNYRGFFNPLPELAQRRDMQFLRTLRSFAIRRRFRNHMLARDIRLRVASKTWKRYFKFCVDRNPWDKTLSHYHYLKKKRSDIRSLDEYLAHGHFCLNHPFYTDDQDHIMVDRVLRYENLDEELEHVFSMLGIPFDGTLQVRAKGQSRDDRRPYAEVLENHQRAAIDAIFKTEIELLGYEWEGTSA